MSKLKTVAVMFYKKYDSQCICLQRWPRKPTKAQLIVLGVAKEVFLFYSRKSPEKLFSL